MKHGATREPAPGERRRLRRGPITIAVRERQGDRVFLCQAGDISAGGMRICKVDEGAPPEASRSVVEFSLPGSDDVIRAEARVVRAERRDRYRITAVRFCGLPGAGRRRIEAYLDGPPLAAPRERRPPL